MIFSRKKKPDAPVQPHPDHWFCHLHALAGRFDDGSLREHEVAEHGGTQITVSFCYGDPNEREKE